MSYSASSGVDKPQPEPGDGLIVYSDSDRFIAGPFMPPTASVGQNEYNHRLEKSAPSPQAYKALLSMVSPDHALLVIKMRDDV